MALYAHYHHRFLAVHFADPQRQVADGFLPRADDLDDDGFFWFAVIVAERRLQRKTLE